MTLLKGKSVRSVREKLGIPSFEKITDNKVIQELYLVTGGKNIYAIEINYIDEIVSGLGSSALFGELSEGMKINTVLESKPQGAPIDIQSTIP